MPVVPAKAGTHTPCAGDGCWRCNTTATKQVMGPRLRGGRQRIAGKRMSGIPITFACGLYDRMLALYTGGVKPDGIDLNFLAIDHAREIFDRMLTNLEFDACEMSSSEYIRHAVRPNCPMVAIPVFLRAYSGTAISPSTNARSRSRRTSPASA